MNAFLEKQLQRFVRTFLKKAIASRHTVACLVLGLILSSNATAEILPQLFEKVFIVQNECNRIMMDALSRLKGDEAALNFLVKRLRQRPIRKIKGDPKVKEWLSQHRVYVSVTTSPKRLVNLHSVLKTLDMENVSQVFVSLPLRFGRTQQEYSIPDSLFINEKIHLLRPEVDEGPVSKLTTAAEHLQRIDPDGFLITIDDDTGYGAGLINEMIFAAAYSPDLVLTGKGLPYSYFGIRNAPPTLASKTPNISGRLLSLKPVDVVEGFATIGYPVRQIPLETIRSFNSRSSEAFASDDMTISLALEKAGVKKYQILSPYFSIGRVQQFYYGYGDDALHRGAGLQYTGTQVNRLKYQSTFRLLKDEVFQNNLH